MDKKALLEEEELIIRQGGEMPEVTYHSSLYYLTQDPEGPGIGLDERDLEILKAAVIDGFRTIILRDLTPDNRGKRLYRGLRRCWVNWRRLTIFCDREGVSCECIRPEVARALEVFLVRETAEIASGARCSSVNCSPLELEELVDFLGLDREQLPDGWKDLCVCEINNDGWLC